MSKRRENPGKKPVYSMFQNSTFMIGLGWRIHKSVVLLCLADALLAVAVNLIELFIAPAVLQKVETFAPLVQLIGTIAIFTLSLLLVRSARAYISENTLFGRVYIRANLTRRINEKLGSTSFPNTENPEVLKHAEKAFDTVSSNHVATEAIWNTLTELVKNTLGVLIYLALLSAVDPVLLAVTVVTSLISYFAGKRLNEWGYRHREEESEYRKRMFYIERKQTDIQLAKDIRIFGMRPWLSEIHDNMLQLYRDFQIRAQRVYIWTDVINVFLIFLRGGVSYLYLLTLTLREGLPASEFLLYFTAIGGFASWITGLMDNFSVLHRQSLDLSVLREFYELPEPFLFEDGEKLEPVPDKAYEIELRHVSFRYPGAEQDTLHDICLTIHPGEKLAIVGLNGAGKTTLVKLICGFYDPTQGEVLLNGEDIRRYDRRDYYRHFSAVFQQFSVLATTLGENVAQCVEKMDRIRVEKCIEKAGLTSTLARLPQGLDTHISREVYEDGVELSGGEMQRLMLARALYKDAPLIILDEPTSALDPIAESEIYQKYNDLISGRTSVFISHRLASTRFCDRILFIENAGIAEEGNHEVLLNKGGRYAQLFEIQSRYYREGGEGNDEF